MISHYVKFSTHSSSHNGLSEEIMGMKEILWLGLLTLSCRLDLTPYKPSPGSDA